MAENETSESYVEQFERSLQNIANTPVPQMVSLDGSQWDNERRQEMRAQFALDNIRFLLGKIQDLEIRIVTLESGVIDGGTP